jgi:hypothetical protein
MYHLAARLFAPPARVRARLHHFMIRIVRAAFLCARLASVCTRRTAQHGKRTTALQHLGRKCAEGCAVGYGLGHFRVLGLARGGQRHAMVERRVARFCASVARVSARFPHCILVHVTAVGSSLCPGKPARHDDPGRPQCRGFNQIASCPHWCALPEEDFDQGNPLIILDCLRSRPEQLKKENGASQCS